MSINGYGLYFILPSPYLSNPVLIFLIIIIWKEMLYNQTNYEFLYRNNTHKILNNLRIYVYID